MNAYVISQCTPASCRRAHGAGPDSTVCNSAARNTNSGPREVPVRLTTYILLQTFSEKSEQITTGLFQSANCMCLQANCPSGTTYSPVIQGEVVFLALLGLAFSANQNARNISLRLCQVHQSRIVVGQTGLVHFIGFHTSTSAPCFKDG